MTYDYARERYDAEWHSRTPYSKHEAKYGEDAPSRAEAAADEADAD